MTIEKSTTAQEIAESYAILLFNYVNGDDKIEDASDIHDAAVKYTKDNIDDFLEATTFLGSAYQIKLLGFIERMIASSYMAAAAEVINKKTERLTTIKTDKK